MSPTSVAIPTPMNCAPALVDPSITREDGSVLFSFDYAGAAPASCPLCGGALRAHGRKSSTFADGPRDGVPTFIRVGFQRRRCGACGYVWRPEFPELEGKGKLTPRALAFIWKRAADGASISAIAEAVGVDRKTVAATLEDSDSSVEVLRMIQTSERSDSMADSEPDSPASSLAAALGGDSDTVLDAWLGASCAQNLRHVATCDADGAVAQVWFEWISPAGARACVDTLSAIVYDTEGTVERLSEETCAAVRAAFQRWIEQGLLIC